jgi:sigma-B regulation protein RsbU (phosphoserine phosphatase)
MAVSAVTSRSRNILVIDDQPEVREALRLVLKGAGYRTSAAASPEDALDVIASDDIHLILADMNYSSDTTSGEEGLRLLDRLAAGWRELPVIAMTGWGSIELAVRAMQRGACDFVTKPWDNGQLLSVVNKYARPDQIRKEPASDMAIARKVQRKLLPAPHHRACGLECHCVSVPLHEIGGDLYDFISIGAHKLGIVLGDVSGKGVAAALLVANLQAAIRSQAEVAPRPERVIGRVNRLFFESTRPEFFATLFFGIYDAKTSVLDYVNCGHPAPVLIRGSGQAERLEATSIILGAFENTTFEEGSIAFGIDDRLVAFSDGFSEAEVEGERDWPYERIRRLARSQRTSIAAALSSLAINARQQADDVTVMDIRCSGLTSES